MKELREKIYPISGYIAIGDISKLTEVSVLTIRYYESLKLLPDPRPKGSIKTRRYSESYISRLIFIRKARELGFSLKEIKQMIKLSDNKKKLPKKRLSKKIHDKVDIINDKMVGLRKLKRELLNLVKS